MSFISNIYVVKDPTNPSNEGKVYLYKFGKKIFDKLNDQMNPEFEDEKAVNPFDLWEGTNFRLKMRNVEGFRNYDKSEFDSPAPLLDDDAKLEEVWKGQYSLQEQIDPSQFKSYDELKSRLYRVLALDGGPQTPTATVDEEIAPAPASDPAPQVAAVDTADDNDESLSFFKKLADD